MSVHPSPDGSRTEGGSYPRGHRLRYLLQTRNDAGPEFSVAAPAPFGVTRAGCAVLIAIDAESPYRSRKSHAGGSRPDNDGCPDRRAREQRASATPAGPDDRRRNVVALTAVPHDPAGGPRTQVMGRRRRFLGPLSDDETAKFKEMAPRDHLGGTRRSRPFSRD